MNNSIVFLLAKKDFLITRKIITTFAIVSLVMIALVYLLQGRVANMVFYNVGFSLLIIPGASCGIVLLMQTNVFEKAKSTQAFIMSLPVTVREFTLAKLLINLPIFGAYWIVICAVAFYFAFGQGVFPMGTLPFITMIFLGIFVAYTFILGVSLLFQSLGITILSIMFFEMGTSAYLWVLAYMEPINTHIFGPVAVWNSTAITIVALQVLAAVFAVSMTYFLQNRKRDFI